MSKYRISVSIDGEKFFWIVVDRERFIRNPTKEDLMRTKLKCYNKTNTCDRCRENNNITDNSILYPGNAKGEKNKEENETGRWICHNCRKKNYQKNNPNSYHNIHKSLRNIRTGNQDPNSNQRKGDNFEELTSIWLGVKRLSVEYDKYSMLSLDHSPIPNGISIKIGDKLVDLSGKIPQTKGKWYDSYNRRWHSNIENEWNKEFDYLFYYCASKNGKIIEIICSIPKEEIKNKRTGIEIVKNPSTGRYSTPCVPWYEKYRIKDEDTLKKVNEIWKKITN